MSLLLTIAAEHEMPEVAKLARVIWNEHYVPIIGQKQVDYMLDKIYSADAMTQQYRQPGHQVYFIALNEERIGFVSITWTKDKNEVFINKFYLLGNRQKKGLGTNVIKQVFGFYPPDSTFRLTVNRQNYKSINFYFKNGFIIESVADFDIGEGYFMNDFIMVKKGV